MKDVPTVKTQQTDPTSLTLPQRKIDNLQNIQESNRNPKHNPNPRNQYRYPVASNLPKQARNNQQDKHNKSKTRKANIPSVNWPNRVKNRNAVTIMTQIFPVENPRASLKNEGT